MFGDGLAFGMILSLAALAGFLVFADACLKQPSKKGLYAFLFWWAPIVVPVGFAHWYLNHVLWPLGSGMGIGIAWVLFWIAVAHGE